ncbi:exonuclease domain-containing protein [Cellulomonas wangsupingiae]|uniref:exonuclease domain-containing protein n=1 Tax=Cellulomonas wangsupingiae TaxID=2968085 RepID=UPI001D0EF11F|nr:exonuclease domain-containing protein [Cellulomonas wangsupingiae]MCM0639597.1 exonuclease domain-containing protein [Cellulomonas wangsupingiae]
MGIFSRLFGPARKVARAGVASGTPVYSVLDVETTGLSPRTHRVLELAIVRVDAAGAVVDEWSSRFNPQGPVGATHIHGITDRDVAHAPLFADAVATISARLAGTVVVAHNARFDIAFVRAEYQRAGWEMPFVPTLCTLQASWHYLPGLDRRRLADCCAATGVSLTHAHSAAGDARATATMFADWLRRNPAHPDLSTAPLEAAALVWPTGPARAQYATTPPSTAPQSQRERRMTTAPPPALASLLSRVDLSQVSYSNAPDHFAVYVEKLVEVLEDGVLDADEAAALADVAEVYGLDEEAVASAHAVVVNLLAHLALADSRITRSEKEEIHRIASELGVPANAIPDLIDEANDQRLRSLSARLTPLPADWSLGEPLRVGDKVAFTGGDPDTREQQERLAGEHGLVVMNNVSRLTAVLVSDGTPSGKATRAAEVGTRVVTPREFATLVRHVQPAR